MGAWDSLRLEAGLCLYGADIDATISPVQVGLAWTIGRRRWIEANFPGATTLLAELASGPSRFQVGLVLRDRVLARAHALLTDTTGRTLGGERGHESGGSSPMLNRGPIAIGYVAADHARPETLVKVIVREVLAARRRGSGYALRAASLSQGVRFHGTD